MTLHLIKLAVGASSVQNLYEYMAGKAARNEEIVHRTRMMPKRDQELLDGGSLYWVVGGQIAMRQTLLDLRPCERKGERKACEIVLDPHPVLTRPVPRRAFQGWRYLRSDEAPADLEGFAEGENELPAELYSRLCELGLL